MVVARQLHVYGIGTYVVTRPRTFLNPTTSSEIIPPPDQVVEPFTISDINYERGPYSRHLNGPQYIQLQFQQPMTQHDQAVDISPNVTLKQHWLDDHTLQVIAKDSWRPTTRPATSSPTGDPSWYQGRSRRVVNHSWSLNTNPLQLEHISRLGTNGIQLVWSLPVLAQDLQEHLSLSSGDQPVPYQLDTSKITQDKDQSRWRLQLNSEREIAVDIQLKAGLKRQAMISA